MHNVSFIEYLPLLTTPNKRETYKKYISTVAEIFGADSDISEEINQLLDFELKLKEVNKIQSIVSRIDVQYCILYKNTS